MTTRRKGSGRLRSVAIAGLLAVFPGVAVAQGTACSSPAFETRLVAAVAKGEVQLKAIPTDKAQDFARCYARRACAALTKIEFEMYALSQISSYGDDKAEKEYLGRMRQHRKENNAAGDKLPPNQLMRDCKAEAGVR